MFRSSDQTTQVSKQWSDSLSALQDVSWTELAALQFSQPSNIRGLISNAGQEHRYTYSLGQVPKPTSWEGLEACRSPNTLHDTLDDNLWAASLGSLLALQLMKWSDYFGMLYGICMNQPNWKHRVHTTPKYSFWTLYSSLVLTVLLLGKNTVCGSSR